MVDSTLPARPLPDSVLARMTPENSIALVNKSDLPHPLPFSAPKQILSLRVSTLTGAGLDALEQRIVALADAQAGQTGSEMIAISARHAESLQRAGVGLDAASEKVRTNGPTELLASDIRAVIEAYGEIAGKIDNEKMLDKLFSTFCIGK